MANEIKRRREEDDDMMLFVFPTMYMLCGTTNSEKIPRHISRLSGKERLQEILEGHVMDCKVAFRMEPHVFKTIANYLREEKLLKDSRGLRRNLGYLCSCSLTMQAFKIYSMNSSIVGLHFIGILSLFSR